MKRNKRDIKEKLQEKGLDFQKEFKVLEEKMKQFAQGIENRLISCIDKSI
ncbi:hypothetical protein [Neobacillus drentensis]|nr:hypothetical protein [Neobacillus drentensis]